MIRLEVQVQRARRDQAVTSKLTIPSLSNGQSHLGHVVIFVIFLAVVVDKYATHAKVRENWWMFLLPKVTEICHRSIVSITYGIFPKDKITCVFQGQVTCPVQSLTNITPFPKLPPGLVFLLLRRPHLAEADFDIRREL